MKAEVAKWLFRECKRTQCADQNAKMLGLRLAHTRNMAGNRTSDTIYILGSGASINNISRSQWKKIEKADTVGVNFWLIHEYVPTFLICELTEETDRVRLLIRQLEDRREDYANTPVIFKGLHKNLDYLRDSHRQWSEGCSYFRTMALPDVSKDSFLKHLRIVYPLRLDRIGFFLQARGTIFMAMHFAICMGYRNIVFLGVDLNDTRYFWEARKDYMALPSGQTGNMHLTNLSYGGRLTIVDAIELMSNQVVKSSKAQVFVGSRSSALFPRAAAIWNWGEG
jgi:hypothetical protein